MDSIAMEECITIMENTFIQLEQDQAFNPLRNSMLIPGENGLLSMMPGYLNKQDIMGIKSVSVYPENANNRLTWHGSLYWVNE